MFSLFEKFRLIGGGNSNGGSGKRPFLCPKCGDRYTHVESLVCKFRILSMKYIEKGFI